MDFVKIGDRLIGPGKPCFIVGEIGINHNGDIRICKKLIQEAFEAKLDAVKFQKRTIEVVYTPEELAKPRENPFGSTNGDLKRGLEFGEKEYNQISEQCKDLGLIWFASCWDEASVDFVGRFDPPCYKIASASLTDENLLKHYRQCNKPIILSTGMSTIEQIDRAVGVLGTRDLIILHCTSTYPAKLEELNLSVIPKLADRYKIPVGYSGHEPGLATTLAAVAMGACVVERHITLDRTMWGSDHAASVEPQGFRKLARDVRIIEKAMGDGVKVVYEREKPIIDKLRRIGKWGLRDN